MRALAAVPAGMAGARMIREPRTVRCGIAARRSGLRRFAHLIARGGWDERFACSRWVDPFCLGAIALAAVYFGLLFAAFLTR